MTQKNISRRTFLKGTLAGAVGMAATGMLGACSASTENNAETTVQTTAGETLTVEENAQSTVDVSRTSIPAWTELNPQDESYDACTTDFADIFSPVQVGHMTLRNRIVKAAAGSDTMPNDATELSQNALDYYGRFADGGAALVILEDKTVGNFGFNQFSSLVLDSYEAGIEEAKKISDRVHQGGAYIGMQMGIGTPLEPGDVNAYTIDEIHDMVTKYGECSARLKEAGFDCVEIKGATTDGLNQFVSRRKNQREDEYGAQTEENRVRFFKEIIEEIRRTCGEDFAILTLINAVEESDDALGNNDGFILMEESKELAKALEEAGADLIQVRVGASGMEANCWATDTNHCAYKADGTTGYGAQFDYAVHWEGLMDGAHSGVGAFIPMAKEIKNVVSIPVGCASYMDPRTAPDMMNDAVADGDVDLIFMNRPLTVDPELPNKLQEGRRDEVAPCTRCFSCHGRPYGEAEFCRVNATTQFAYTDEFPEGYDLTPAQSPKKVMVVGGGVAGLEAARIAAERGHSVTLYEKNEYLGGMLLFAEAVKGTHERLADLRTYLSRQQEVKGVTVVTGTEVTVDLVKEENPDAVIVAVGGARESRVSGSNVINMDDFAGAEIGDRVVILGANLQATDLAQYLIAQGKQVQLVHEKTADQVDIEQSYWVRTYVRAHLYAHGVKVWNECTVNGVSTEGVAITMASGLEKILPCDTVIECYDMIPNTALLEEIQQAGFDVYAAGCDDPKTIQSSIHAGYKVSRYLE